MRWFVCFGVIPFLLAACSPSARLVDSEFLQYAFTDSTLQAADPDMVQFMLPYKVRVDSEMNDTIGFTARALERGRPESLLGNYVADLCLEEVNALVRATAGPADFCFLNNGGLRHGLPEGAITRGHVFELMPFENELVVITLEGIILKRVLDWIARRGGEPVSGLRMRIRNGHPAGISIQGLPVSPDRTYRAVTSSYLANGGDDLSFLADSLPRLYAGLRIRDAVIRHTLALYHDHRSIDPVLDKRLAYE